MNTKVRIEVAAMIVELWNWHTKPTFSYRLWHIEGGT